MKSCLFCIACLLVSCLSVSAQDRNCSPDSIVGKYFVTHDGEDSKVEMSKCADGTYEAHVYWVRNAYDENGRKRTDEKNPDKEMRSTPCDQIRLVWDLRYNPEKKRWDKGKIYDPTRGIRANATMNFGDDGNLLVRGSLMGISETIVWVPVDE